MVKRDEETVLIVKFFITSDSVWELPNGAASNLCSLTYQVLCLIHFKLGCKTSL